MTWVAATTTAGYAASIAQNLAKTVFTDSNIWVWQDGNFTQYFEGGTGLGHFVGPMQASY